MREDLYTDMILLREWKTNSNGTIVISTDQNERQEIWVEEHIACHEQDKPLIDKANGNTY